MDRIDALKQLVKRFDENYKEYKRDTYNEHSCVMSLSILFWKYLVGTLPTARV